MRTPPPKIVLWDIDGTLLLNSARAGAFYHDAIREVAGVGPGPDEPHAVEHGKTDAQIITERLERWGGDPALFDAVSARMDELSDAYLTDAGRREAAAGVTPRRSGRSRTRAGRTGSSPGTRATALG